MDFTLTFEIDEFMKSIKRPENLRKPSNSQQLHFETSAERSEVNKILLQDQLETKRADARAIHEWKIFLFEKIALGAFAVYATLMGYKIVAQYQDMNGTHQMNLTLAKNAFKDVWPVLYEYKMAVDNLGSTMQSMHFNREVFKNKLIQDRAKFDKEANIENEKFHLAFMAIGKQQHILGEVMTRRAFDYLRFERVIASVYEDERRDDGKGFMESINADAVAEAENIVSKLRTDLSDIDKTYSNTR